MNEEDLIEKLDILLAENKHLQALIINYYFNHAMTDGFDENKYKEHFGLTSHYKMIPINELKKIN